MNKYLEDIFNLIAEQVKSSKGLVRERKAQDQSHLPHGVEHLIIQLWDGTQFNDGY